MSHPILIGAIIVGVIMIGGLGLYAWNSWNDSYVYVGTVNYCTQQDTSQGCDCAICPHHWITLSTTNKIHDIIQVTSTEFELIGCSGRIVSTYAGYIAQENVQKTYGAC